MNAGRSKATWIVRVYLAALSLFPPAYRREFGDELLYAVGMGAAEAAAQGESALLGFAWRELRDLPLAILRAHLHERRSPMDLRPGAHLPGGPLSAWQLGAVFIPFLLPMLNALRFAAFNQSVPWLLTALALALLVLLGLTCIAGFYRKFPVWALPGLSLLFFFVSAALQFLAQAFVFLAVMLPLYGGWPDDPLGAKIAIMLLVQAIYLVIMVVATIVLLRVLPGFHERVRQEWTLLSFLFYGIAILPVIGNDEFHGVEPHEVISLLILAAGAALYLVAPWRWLRVMALIVPAILSPVVMSLGLYQVFPMQPWSSDVLSFRLWESLQPVLYLSPLPVLLVLAALARFLPWKVKGAPDSLPAASGSANS
jgi:hypothetical protein